MTLKRGDFKMICDEPGCDEEVDLETDDFDTACSLKMDEEGWTHFAHGGRGFKDYCPTHNPMER
jgi:hypothetical protein